MDKVVVKCCHCFANFYIENYNTTIVGPVFTTTCPTCKKVEQRNFSKFVEWQVTRGANQIGSIGDARKMIALANKIEERVFQK